MKLESLQIWNFRSISYLKAANLTSLVSISGANGTGKSTVFHALRLLKTAYGQYDKDEWSQLRQAFGVNLSERNSDEFMALDKHKPLRIQGTFSFSEAEILLISKNAFEYYKRAEWLQFQNMRSNEYGSYTVNPQDRQNQGRIVDTEAQKRAEVLGSTLSNGTFEADFSEFPDGKEEILPCPILELVFSQPNDSEVGIIDYHDASRVFNRQPLYNIPMNSKTTRPSSVGSIVNTNNKYQNLKSQLAGSYIQALLKKEAGGEETGINDLNQVIMELFSKFIPGKTYFGPTPTNEGDLKFPIGLSNGGIHDIDELSSGEKEVLFGYLRLRYQTPKNSIILIDEPELHLNPKLCLDLPSFYQRFICNDRGCQVIMITHSDAVLRGAFELPDRTLLHMRSIGSKASADNNQMSLIEAASDAREATLELVGDLASFDPAAVNVLLEGENSKVDEKIIKRFFPEFAAVVNLISVGPKQDVKNSRTLLEKIELAKGGNSKYVCIVDQDYDSKGGSKFSSVYTWPVYHIENFLLSPEAIAAAIQALTAETPLPLERIDVALYSSASRQIDVNIRIRLNHDLALRTQKQARLKFLGGADSQGNFWDVEVARYKEAAMSFLADLEKIPFSEILARHRRAVETELVEGTWKSSFRGRDIIKDAMAELFTGAVKGPHYEAFIYTIIDQMASKDLIPMEMKSMISKITADLGIKIPQN